jgi:hypothetical protein
MSNLYYKDGVRAARSGSDPSPPKHTVVDTVVGVSEKSVKGMAEDYKRGYAAGSQQRVADGLSRKGKS